MSDVRISRRPGSGESGALRRAMQRAGSIFRLMVMLTMLMASPVYAINTTANQIGRLTSEGNDEARTFYQYDPLGRTTATLYALDDGSAHVFEAHFTYPQTGVQATGLGVEVGQELFPDGETVAYAHDATGRPMEIRTTFGAVTADIAVSIRHNALDQTTSITYGDGTVSTYIYDPATLRLQSIETRLGAAVLQNLSHSYDPNGNITGITNNVRPVLTASYEYDALDQLTVVKNGAGNPIETYRYDAIGNLVHRGGLDQTYGGSGRGPHALATSGTGPQAVTFNYDANGNVTSIGSGLSLTWNAENMAVRQESGEQVIEKSFIGEHNWKKVEGGATTYYLPSLRIEGGALRKFYGPYAERSPEGGPQGVLRFYHPDHLGSAVLVTETGVSAPAFESAYLPWGHDRGAEGDFRPKYRFNFKEQESTGLYDYGARLYSPTTGRWLSPDSTLSDGPNRYSYALNNPTSLLDPSGHFVQNPAGRPETDEMPRLAPFSMTVKAPSNPTIGPDPLTAWRQRWISQQLERYSFLKGGMIPHPGSTGEFALWPAFYRFFNAVRWVDAFELMDEDFEPPMEEMGVGSGAAKAALKARRALQVRINARIGKAGEVFVAKHLLQNGMKVIGQQVRVLLQGGERRIDLLVDKAGQLYALEVKTGGAARDVIHILRDDMMATAGGLILGGQGVPVLLKYTHQVIKTIEVSVPTSLLH